MSDKFSRLYDEHEQLKKDFIKQANEAAQMQFKIVRLEAKVADYDELAALLTKMVENA